MTDQTARPDVRIFLDYVNALPGPRTHELGPEGARAVARQARDLVDLPIGPLAVRRDFSCDGSAGPIPLRLLDTRATRPPGPVLVYFHGGGFVTGDLDTHEPVCAAISRGLDLPVVSVDYRLAPDHVWPAAPDDCETAVRWVAEGHLTLGLEPTGLVLAGDSAGGSLCIITTLALRDRPAAVPQLAQWPIYPSTDAAPRYQSFKLYADGHFLTRQGMAWFSDLYAADLTHWRGAPILADHAGTPPTLLLSAGLDPIRDQARAYAAALVNAGVPTVYREAVGNIHGFLQLRKVVPSSESDLQAALRILKTMIAEASGPGVGVA